MKTYYCTAYRGDSEVMHIYEDYESAASDILRHYEDEESYDDVKDKLERGEGYLYEDFTIHGWSYGIVMIIADEMEDCEGAELEEGEDAYRVDWIEDEQRFITTVL